MKDTFNMYIYDQSLNGGFTFISLLRRLQIVEHGVSKTPPDRQHRYDSPCDILSDITFDECRGPHSCLIGDSTPSKLFFTWGQQGVLKVICPKENVLF